MLGDRATLRYNGNPCARVPPSGAMFIQNFARNPVLVNNRLSAASYRTQTLASNLAKSHILLVDDSPTKLLALESALASLGQNLLTARSAAAALRYLLAQHCAVLLLAVHMP